MEIANQKWGNQKSEKEATHQEFHDRFDGSDPQLRLLTVFLGFIHEPLRQLEQEFTRIKKTESKNQADALNTFLTINSQLLPWTGWRLTSDGVCYVVPLSKHKELHQFFSKNNVTLQYIENQLHTFLPETRVLLSNQLMAAFNQNLKFTPRSGEMPAYFSLDDKQVLSKLYDIAFPFVSKMKMDIEGVVASKIVGLQNSSKEMTVAESSDCRM